VFQDALRVAADLGAEILEIVVPDPTAMIADWFPLCAVETAVAHEATYPSRKSDYGPGLAGLIELGLQQSGKDYQKIVLRREAFKGMVRVLFEKVDLLAVPAQTFAAPTLAKMATLGENPELITGLLRFSCPFDMTEVQPLPFRAALPKAAVRSHSSLWVASSMKPVWSLPVTHSSALPTGIAAIPRFDDLRRVP
jgi:Asp-tRNA(Asn)/Glu-tRNA(Gln) amidotransferase A subunit family amidase